MVTAAPLHSDENNLLSEANSVLLRFIVGLLMYVTACMRSNISFAVRELGRFTHQSTQAHLAEEKRVLRRIKGTKNPLL